MRHLTVSIRYILYLLYLVYFADGHSSTISDGLTYLGTWSRYFSTQPAFACHLAFANSSVLRSSSRPQPAGDISYRPAIEPRDISRRATFLRFGKPWQKPPISAAAVANLANIAT
ncbi:hypothetical protein F4803DRAFT_191811 [Xylaria telfairii]|nr:hypothetical protein F4803DRAFT_191811 [Xylaria telfairii]